MIGIIAYYSYLFQIRNNHSLIRCTSQPTTKSKEDFWQVTWSTRSETSFWQKSVFHILVELLFCPLPTQLMDILANFSAVLEVKSWLPSVTCKPQITLPLKNHSSLRFKPVLTSSTDILVGKTETLLLTASHFSRFTYLTLTKCEPNLFLDHKKKISLWKTVILVSLLYASWMIVLLSHTPSISSTSSSFVIFS